jgi:hypothetical protein
LQLKNRRTMQIAANKNKRFLNFFISFRFG